VNGWDGVIVVWALVWMGTRKGDDKVVEGGRAIRLANDCLLFPLKGGELIEPEGGGRRSSKR